MILRQFKLRRKRFPLLSNFLLTSDNISADDSSISPKDLLSSAPRSHPPPLYYLPFILTPAQEDFLKRRKVDVRPLDAIVTLSSNVVLFAGSRSS